MATIEEIQEKRAARKAERERLFNGQRAKDLEAINELEEQLGDDQVIVVELDLDAWAPGTVTLIGMKKANDVHYRRFLDVAKSKQEGKPGDRLGAVNQLAASCRIYPAELDEYKKLIDTNPAVHTAAGAEVLKRAQGEESDRGKG